MNKNIFSIFLSILFTLTLSAQPKEKNAVIVGMKYYQYPINQILNGQITANMIKTRLVLYQDWDDDNINYLTDPDKDDVQIAINTMPKTTNDTDFFYFVGHGYNNGDNRGIITLNTYWQDGELADKINPTELQGYFGSFNDYCAFIDACYSGMFTEMTTGFIGTSSLVSEATWGGSIGGYTPFGGALGQGISTLTNQIPIGTLTAEGLFDYAEPIARNISGNHPQYSDNYSGNLLITTPAYDVSFANVFQELPNQGTLIIDGETQSLPYSTRKYYGYNMSIQATSRTISGISYTFNHWENSSTNNPRSATITSDLNIMAYYTGKPTNTYRSLSFNYGDYGEEIVLSWDAHPLDNNGIDKYEIYRKVKNNGVIGPTNNIGTVYADGSDDYSFEDIEYLVSNQTYILCYYDVRAHYVPNDTYPDPDFAPIFGDPGHDIISNDSHEQAYAEVEEEVSETTLGNFPNPFNPTTNISYVLAKDGFVSLKVFNVLGKEVATLVNETKPAGNYSVSFDASNMPSGVYICTLQTNGQSITRKIMLMK